MRPTAAKALFRPFHMSARSASSRGSGSRSRPPRARARPRSRTCARPRRAGPSTSMRSAAPTSGQSSPVAALAATIARRSIISIAAGTMPEAMIAETGAPASSVEGNVAKNVRVACGLRRIRSTTSVTMPSIPSLPDEDAQQVVARRVEDRAAEVHDRARPPRTTRAPSTWFDGEAVLQAVRAARVLGDVAADRADALRGRVGRVVVAGGARSPC